MPKGIGPVNLVLSKRASLSEPGFAGFTDFQDGWLGTPTSLSKNKRYLLNGTWEYQTQNPENLPILKILVRTMLSYSDGVIG